MGIENNEMRLQAYCEHPQRLRYRIVVASALILSQTLTFHINGLACNWPNCAYAMPLTAMPLAKRNADLKQLNPSVVALL